MDERFTHFEDKPSFAEVEVLANRYLQAYQAGELDRLDVVYTKFETMSRQHAVVETLLPLGALETAQEENGPGIEIQYEFLPSAESIVDEVVPTSFKVRLFKCLLDAAVSEQIARRVAMKNAHRERRGNDRQPVDRLQPRPAKRRSPASCWRSSAAPKP